MSRPLSVSPPPPPPKDQAFILGDGWTSERAARHLLRTYRISVKAWSKPSRGGVTVKHKDIDEVFKAWDPFIFSPPAYLLHLDPRPGTNRLVDARAISRRVTIIIKTYLEDEVQGASFNPALPPQSHRLSPSLFGQGQGPSSSSTRVVFTFRNWYDVHVALRSTFTIGSDDQETTQFPDLWIDPDLLQPSNFCSRCGDAQHTSFSGECKRDSPAKFCGFCGSPDHKVFNCNYRSRARETFASLVISEASKASYDERRMDFNKALYLCKTYDPASPELSPPSLIPLGPRLIAALSPPTAPAEHKMEITSPVHAYDDVSMEDFFTQPKSASPRSYPPAR